MLVAFDLDGTLFNCEHRLHLVQERPKQWKTFFELIPQDEPVEPIISLYKRFKKLLGISIIIVTARPESTRQITEQQLDYHCLEFDQLYMRPHSDFRPDYLVKRDIMTKKVYRDFHCMPSLAFDDKQQVLDEYADLNIIGVLCT